MRWSLILLSMLGLVAASPIDVNVEEADPNEGVTRNSIIEGQLKLLLEDFRKTMVTGSNDIPILDPLVVDFLAIDEDIVPVPGLKISIGDTKVNKLSSFVVDQLTVQRTTLLPLRYQATIDLQIPVLELDAGHYDLSVPIDGLTIFGRGDAKINLIEPRITGHVIARLNLGLGSLFIRLQECQLKFTLKGFESQITGLLGGDEGVGAFVNTFLKHFVPDLVKLYEEDITETLSSVVLEVGNELLADINLIDILG